MVPLGRGSVALVPFPFSDLSQAKLRPAIVLLELVAGTFSAFPPGPLDTYGGVLYTPCFVADPGGV